MLLIALFVICLKTVLIMLKEKISVLIIGKDQESVLATEKLLIPFSELDVVAKATSGKQGLSMGNQYVPHLLIINDWLSDANGLKFVKELQNKGIDVEVIFTSKNSKLAYESLELKPIDFWVDPVSKETVEKMIVRFKQKMKKNELFRRMDKFIKAQASTEKRIFFQKKGIIVLHPGEIVFGKAQLSNTQLKLNNSEDVLLRTKIGETLEILNNSDYLRIGRSYFINRNYLWKIDKKKLKCMLYCDGQTWEVPVSKSTVSSLDKLNAQLIY